jgi:hypothetical protein
VNEPIQACFPDLVVAGYHITSQATSDYNCIAWAADDDARWWWPDPFGDYYWPAQAPRVETLEAFITAYRLLGYEPCATDDVEANFERVAFYVDSQGIPTHAARQLPSGAWTSKLGTLEDIEHTALEGLNGVIYGRVGQLLRRARSEGAATQ